MGLAAAATADLRSQDLVGPQGSCQFQVGGATLAVLALSSLSRKKLQSKFSFFIQITSLFFHLFFCSCFPQPHAVSASSQRTTAPFQDCYQVSRLQDSKELKSALSCVPSSSIASKTGIPLSAALFLLHRRQTGSSWPDVHRDSFHLRGSRSSDGHQTVSRPPGRQRLFSACRVFFVFCSFFPFSIFSCFVRTPPSFFASGFNNFTIAHEVLDSLGWRRATPGLPNH